MAKSGLVLGAGLYFGEAHWMPPEQPPIILTPAQAIFVLIVIFAVPVVLLLFDGRFTLPTMLLDSLGLSFLWNKSTDDDAFSYDKRRSKRKKIVRSRAEQGLTVSEGAWFLNDICSSLISVKPLPNLQDITPD
jgi:hypothetical protein